MPIENSSYASNIENDNGSYGKAMLGLRSHPSFGLAGLDIAAIILLSLIFGSIVGVNVLDIIRSKYDTTIAMRERELSEANVKKAFEEEITRIANSMNMSPKKAKKYFEKYLATSYIKPNGKADKEIGMNAVRGYGMEKYTLMKDMLTPIVMTQKAFEKANKTQKPEDIKLAKEMQEKIPSGVLLYGPAGSGKTYIANKIGEHLEKFGTRFVDLNIRRSLEKNIETFDEAIHNAKDYFKETGNYTVILLNDLTSKFKKCTEEFDMMLYAMEHSKKYGIVFVLTANDPKLMDKSLFREGRLEVRMPIGEMKDFENADMINFALHTFENTKNKVKEFDIQEVVDKIEKENWAFTPAEFMGFVKKMARSNVINADEMIRLMDILMKKDQQGMRWNALTPEVIDEFYGDIEYVDNLYKEESEE